MTLKRLLLKILPTILVLFLFLHRPWARAEEGSALNRTPASVRIPVSRLAQADPAKLEAAGIRKLSGRHLTLFTDAPSNEQVDSLPRLFDLAYPEWCGYFDVRPPESPRWHIFGCLIRDKRRFESSGLFPADLPEFLHGYSVGSDLWLFDQESDYYRRHLLLHEGTHAFMNTVVGGTYWPWFSEGVAELLATHRIEDGQLTLAYFPASREDVPMLGRIKIIQDAKKANRLLRLGDVIDFEPRVFLTNDSYAWSWATAAFLDGNPNYRRRFRELIRETEAVGSGRRLEERFAQLFSGDWVQLRDEWELFVATLEHGHDLARTAIDFSPGRPLANGDNAVTVAVDRGWQNSGLVLEDGATFQLDASGRYQVDDEPQIWWCEPGGVSMRYYDGRPLGMLLAAVRSEKPADDEGNAFLHPVSVGLGTELTPNRSGTLYLKINDSAGELGDNRGSVQVKIRREP